MRHLQVERHITSFRLWVNRSAAEGLATMFVPGEVEPDNLPGDRLRARAELESVRQIVADDPEQVARVDELVKLLERDSARTDAAIALARSPGQEAARAALGNPEWRDDRLRTRELSSAMVIRAREGFGAQQAAQASTLLRIRILQAIGVALFFAGLLYVLLQARAAARARESAEAATALARERLSDLEGVLDTVPAAVFITRDREGRQVRGNRAARELMRMPDAANLSLVTPPEGRVRATYRRAGEDVPPAALPLQVSAATGRPVDEGRLELTLPDGTVRHVLGQARPLLDLAGEPRGAVAAFVDVTDLVRTEDELREALERNRALLASAHRSELLYREMARNFPNGAIALFDHDLRFLIFDGSRFAIRRGVSANVGRTIAEIFPPEIAGRLEPAHRDALRGQEGQVEVIIGGRTMEIVTRPVRDESGDVIMGIAMSQDVTEERALRNQLSVSSRLAAMGTLVAGVAHEVNNPLAGAIGSLSSALGQQREISATLRGADPVDRSALADEADDVVDALLDADVGLDRIARIVKDLSLFGRPNPMRTRVRLGDVVTSAMRWLPASVGRLATVHVDDEGAPDVHASAGQLEQVVVNLVSNGARAIPEGRRGEVRVRIATSPEGRAALEVRDDGAGIDPVTLERIFDPFFTTREVGQGMGLGLPICHAIVTAHGGSLTVASEPGKGSTFRMELPPLA
ncbi:MAG: ATP-binding protein [Anaeromyxobacteraceae bacterium]